MNNMIQLDFFPEDQEIKELKKTITEVKVSSDKVRRGLFARHGELSKMYIDLANRLDIIERNICKEFK